jgi:hypothetical protein
VVPDFAMSNSLFLKPFSWPDQPNEILTDYQDAKKKPPLGLSVIQFGYLTKLPACPNVPALFPHIAPIHSAFLRYRIA